MANRSPVDDTSPDARAIVARLYAKMSPAEKLARVRDLTFAANRLSLAGLRSRHPEESEGALLLRLAKLRLGDDLVRRAYRDVPSDA
jgi:hypothetical protein